MIKYSACYVRVNPNFVIQNLDEKDLDGCIPAFSIVQNILTRGCPTIPSKLLTRKFGQSILDKWTDFIYILDFDDLNWDNTIKGGDKSNPARELYENKFGGIPGINPRYAGTFIPELSMCDIVYDFKDKPNTNSNVDFYSPAYKRDIEVDGWHHNETTQRVRDKERDEIFEAARLKKPIRIKEGGSSDFGGGLIENKDYTDKLQDLDIIDDYSKENLYMFAIRLQLLLINLYMKGDLKLDDEIVYLNFHTDLRLPRSDAKVIVEDFYDLLSNILALQNIDFTRPNVYIRYWEDEDDLVDLEGINIDISLKKVYSETHYSEQVYCIRNDYFLYDEKMFFDKDTNDTYSYKKNYYKISFNNVHYELNPETHTEALEYILKNTSNGNEYDDGFRENQLQIIIDLLNTTGVFGVLPTGAGKSLCYQIASMLIPSMTLVIAPLQLLMFDQARSANKHFGITNVAVINASSGRQKEIFSQRQALISIVSPERFFNKEFEKILNSFKKDQAVGFIVIDEIHCLSEWGHDFRTSYLCLSHKLRDYFPPSTYLMALTGTASYAVFDDVEAELKAFKQDNRSIKPIFAESMKRDNLTIKVIKVKNYYQELIKIVQRDFIDKGMNDKMIIFTKVKDDSENARDSSGCNTIEGRLAVDFNNYDIRNVMAHYSGGDDIPDDERKSILQKFDRGDLKLIIATKAFGMGVDISDIRTTIHIGIPSSLESLYQEMGRAGRDNKPSTCYVLYKEEEGRDIRELFSKDRPKMEQLKKKRKYLKELQTNVYFITTSNLDPEVERDLINLVKNKIKEFIDTYDGSSDGLTVSDFYSAIINSTSDNLHTIDFGTKKGDYGRKYDITRELVEKALYRLYLLGEINMWNVVYGVNLHNPTYVDLSFTDFDNDEKMDFLKLYIARYHQKVDLEGKENTPESRMDFLINWTNKTFLYERFKSLENLYKECVNYKNPEKFMDDLAGYFKNDYYADAIIENPNSIDRWLNMLSYLSPEDARLRLSRLLESYDDLAGVNYVSGITYLRLDQFDHPDGKYRLSKALEIIDDNFSKELRGKLFNRTYPIIEDKYKDAFVEFWISFFPSDAQDIYHTTNNNFARICAFMADSMKKHKHK